MFIFQSVDSIQNLHNYYKNVFIVRDTMRVLFIWNQIKCICNTHFVTFPNRILVSSLPKPKLWFYSEQEQCDINRKSKKRKVIILDWLHVQFYFIFLLPLFHLIPFGWFFFSLLKHEWWKRRAKKKVVK